MGNKYEELEKLKNLKDNGVIAENEFEIEKQKILNSNNINKTINRQINEKTLNILKIMIIVATIFSVILFISFLIYVNNNYYKIKDYTIKNDTIVWDMEELERYNYSQAQKEYNKIVRKINLAKDTIYTGNRIYILFWIAFISTSILYLIQEILKHKRIIKPVIIIVLISALFILFFWLFDSRDAFNECKYYFREPKTFEKNFIDVIEEYDYYE